jgi:hypothetical protein
MKTNAEANPVIFISTLEAGRSMVEVCIFFNRVSAA